MVLQSHREGNNGRKELAKLALFVLQDEEDCRLEDYCGFCTSPTNFCSSVSFRSDTAQ